MTDDKKYIPGWHAHPHDPEEPPGRCPCCGQVCEGRTLYPTAFLSDELWAAIKARMLMDGLILTPRQEWAPGLQIQDPIDPTSTTGQRVIF